MHAFVPGRGAEIQQLYLIASCPYDSISDLVDLQIGIGPAGRNFRELHSNIKEGNLDFEIKAESDDEIGQLCQDFEEMRLQTESDMRRRRSHLTERIRSSSVTFPMI